jgi:predicted  nucleic acid-binding Zn-ribbon protein
MNNLMIWEVAPTKTDIENYATNVANELAEGTMKAEDVAVKMAAIETFAKSLRTKVEDHVIDFLDKCPKGKYDHLGASLSLKDIQTYDYAAYSPEWAELQSQIDVLKEKQKEIEENGKKYERGQIPLKSYKRTYSITLNK